jgi:A/G-specific adenine glycosylase
MPWKGEKDPYRIWLSEIILQQTRVEQGMSYYQKFISNYPTVHHLAHADDQQVFKLWEGLGYYSRCRNLIASAKYISKELNGQFPNTYDAISKLKGVGPYTTAAIASFAYNLPFAVLDGNVYRILSRLFGISTPIDSSEGKKQFSVLSQKLLDEKHPALYNQAIMDFGATVCKPAPNCDACPFTSSCVAFVTNSISELPVKSKKIKIRKRWFHYLIIEHNGHIAIRQRTSRDIWNQLYEYPLIETDDQIIEERLIEMVKQSGIVDSRDIEVVEYSDIHKQQLSHQLIHGRFLHVLTKEKPVGDPSWLWLPESRMKEYPFPRLINSYLQRSAVPSK